MFRGFIPAWCRLMPTTILIFVFLEKLTELTGEFILGLHINVTLMGVELRGTGTKKRLT